MWKVGGVGDGGGTASGAGEWAWGGWFCVEGRGDFCNGKDVCLAKRETLTGQAHEVRLLAK